MSRKSECNWKRCILQRLPWWHWPRIIGFHVTEWIDFPSNAWGLNMMTPFHDNAFRISIGAMLCFEVFISKVTFSGIRLHMKVVKVHRRRFNCRWNIWIQCISYSMTFSACIIINFRPLEGWSSIRKYALDRGYPIFLDSCPFCNTWRAHHHHPSTHYSSIDWETQCWAPHSPDCSW